MEHLSPPPTSGPNPAPPQGTPLPPVQPSYAPHQPYTPQGRKPNIIKRALRFLLRRAMYVGVVLGRGLAPFKVALFILLPLFALVCVLTTALMWNRIVGPAAEVAHVESLPSSPEIEAFLEGQRTYDAEKMWESFSPAVKNQSNMSIDQLKQSAQDERMAGISYLRPIYIGGVPLEEGGAIYFYLVNARAPSVSGSVPLSFQFMVDKSGKILDIKLDVPGGSSS